MNNTSSPAPTVVITSGDNPTVSVALPDGTTAMLLEKGEAATFAQARWERRRAYAELVAAAERSFGAAFRAELRAKGLTESDTLRAVQAIVAATADADFAFLLANEAAAAARELVAAADRADLVERANDAARVSAGYAAIGVETVRRCTSPLIAPTAPDGAFRKAT